MLAYMSSHCGFCPSCHFHVYLAEQVLPHLLEEVRTEQLQQLVLPLIIHILGKQDKQVRSDSALHASAMCS